MLRKSKEASEARKSAGQGHVRMQSGIPIVDGHVDHCKNSCFHSVRWEDIGDFWAEKWQDLPPDFQDDSGCVESRLWVNKGRSRKTSQRLWHSSRWEIILTVSRRVAGEVMNECTVTTFKKETLLWSGTLNFPSISFSFVVFYVAPWIHARLYGIILEHYMILHDIFSFNSIGMHPWYLIIFHFNGSIIFFSVSVTFYSIISLLLEVYYWFHL